MRIGAFGSIGVGGVDGRSLSLGGPKQRTMERRTVNDRFLATLNPQFNGQAWSAFISDSR